MRNTKKNRETAEKLRAAIVAECEKTYGKKIGTNAKFFDWALKTMPQPNWGKNWALCSHNEYIYDYGWTTIATCYYTGKKPSKNSIGRFCEHFEKVSEKDLRSLININYEKLPSVIARNEWEKGVEALEEKKKKSKQAEKEMKLDFDGEISIKEIANKFANYYVDWKRTKISFHERCGANSHKRVPEMSINIKPSRIERFANGSFTYVYNEKEFNEKMANAKHTPKISDEQIAFARKNGIIAMGRKTCIILAYSWKGTDSYWTSSARHYDFNILTKKGAFKKEVLLLKKIRDTKKYI